MSTAVSAFSPATLPAEPSPGASLNRLPELAAPRPFAEFNLRSEPRPARQPQPDEARPNPSRPPEETDAAEPVSPPRRPRRSAADNETESADEVLACPCAVAVLPPPALEPPVPGGPVEETTATPASTEATAATGLTPPAGLAPGDSLSLNAAGNWRDSLRSQATPAGASASPATAAENIATPATERAFAAESALLSRAQPLPPAAAESNLPTAPAETGTPTSPAAPNPAEMAAKQGESPHGTPAASPAVEVKSWFQRDEFAALTPPPAGAGAATGLPSRPHRERPATAAATTELSPVSNLSADRTGDAGVPAGIPDLPAVSPADQVAKVTALLQDQVIRFRQTAREAVEVVLKPDSRTELHVQLVQRAGQIEATVRCDRGDAQALGSSWSRLQESLAQQGVRLAPLSESSLAFAGEHSRQGFNPPRQPLPEASSFVPVSRPRTNATVPATAPPSVAGPRTAFSSNSRRPLESWA